MAKGNIILPENLKLAKDFLDKQHEINKEKIKQGLMGQIWGNYKYVPNNIAGFTVIFLVLSGIVYTCVAWRTDSSPLAVSAKELWLIITPLITLSIGYLFGKRTDVTDD